jgi:hypothetical protein
MAYIKTTWTDDVTPLSAANMNNLETQYEKALADVVILPRKWTQIATTILASDAASVDFISISTDYNYLMVIGEYLASSNTTTARALRMRFNDDSGEQSYWFGKADLSANTLNAYYDLGLTGALLVENSGSAIVGKSNFEFVIYEQIETSLKLVSGISVIGKRQGSGLRHVGGWANKTDKVAKITMYAAVDNILAGAKFTLLGAV